MWDYEDAGAFTREELDEYVAEPLRDTISTILGDDSAWVAVYLDDNDNLDVDITVDGATYNITTQVDKRRARFGRDLEKYVPTLARKFHTQYLAETENDDIEATTEICYRDRDNDDRVVALDVGMSPEEVKEMLAAHPSYYRSTMEYDEARGITCATEPNPEDWEFTAVPLRSLKKGTWFTIKPIAYPNDNQVYIKDDFDRELKKFMCGRCDDISYSTYFKGDKLVYTDFIY